MNKALIALIVSLALPTAANAAACRDSHGKFIKCPHTASPAPHRCKDAKGKFAKCGTPGTHPA